MVLADASKSECVKLNEVAQRTPGFHPSVSFSVTGKDRVFLHSAPSQKCKIKDLFVMPGESLTAYVPHNGWIYIMYVNPKSGRDFMGWVKESRLQYIGKNTPF